MLRNQNIIVGTDFSPSSDMAIKCADELQRKTGGKVHIIHACNIAKHLDWFSNDTSQPYLLSHFNSDLKASLKEKMAQQLKRCESVSESHVIIGDEYAVLHESAEKFKAGIIVLGHKGSSGLFNLGGMGQKIVASSPIPVLVVNNYKEIKKISALVDPANISEELIEVSNEFAEVFSAELQLVSLWPDLSSPQFPFIHYVQPMIMFSEENKEEIKSKIKKEIEKRVSFASKKVPIKIEVTTKDIGDSLVEAIEKDRIDLAVMLRHHKSVLKEFLIGSTTRKVLDGAKTSLLVLPEKGNK